MPAESVADVESDTIADVEPVSKYDSWRKQQIEAAETVFPTEERDALVSRLIDAGEKVNRAEGRDAEWLAAEREDLTDSYNDRGNAIGEVGARNEKQRLLQQVTKFEAMALEAQPPDAMPDDAMADVESDTIAEPDSLEIPASQSLEGHLLSDQSGKVQFVIVPTADLKRKFGPLPSLGTRNFRRAMPFTGMRKVRRPFCQVCTLAHITKHWKRHGSKLRKIF